MSEMPLVDSLLATAGLFLGGVLMTAFSGSRLANTKETWSKLTVSVCIVAAVVSATQSLYYYGMPGYLVLIRDIVASFLIAAGITFAIAGVARRLALRGTRPAIRILLCSVATLILGILAPVVGLMVHCTSTDCL